MTMFDDFERLASAWQPAGSLRDRLREGECVFIGSRPGPWQLSGAEPRADWHDTREVEDGFEGLVRACSDNFFLMSPDYPLWDYALSISRVGDVRDLREFVLEGNVAIREGVVLGDLAFVQQVNGGDEWAAFKARPDGTWRQFTSASMEAVARKGGPQAVERLVAGMALATPAQCASLDYNLPKTLPAARLPWTTIAARAADGRGARRMLVGASLPGGGLVAMGGEGRAWRVDIRFPQGSGLSPLSLADVRDPLAAAARAEELARRPAELERELLQVGAVPAVGVVSRWRQEVSGLEPLDIVVRRCQDGTFDVHYGYDEDRGFGESSADGFGSLDEAEAALRRQRAGAFRACEGAPAAVPPAARDREER